MDTKQLTAAIALAAVAITAFAADGQTADTRAGATAPAPGTADTGAEPAKTAATANPSQTNERKTRAEVKAEVARARAADPHFGDAVCSDFFPATPVRFSAGQPATGK
ncbi:MAG: hypothetical protein V4634_12830 [Pseudomonadota bacterium]